MIKSILSKTRAYYFLTKPGISRAQILTVSIGFFLAKQVVEFNSVFYLLVVGTYFFSSAASVGNSLIEVDLDKLMNRTEGRPLPSNQISKKEAGVIMVACLFIGSILLIKINWLTFGFALTTLVTYILIYTPLKQVSWVNTLFGAIPGALPLLGGWAASGTPIHIAGVSLFFTLYCWQMPHFYALSIMYFDDYKKAGFKMLPIEDDHFVATKRQIIIFTILMILSSLYPFMVSFLSGIYFVGVLIISAIFFIYSIKFTRDITKKNARKLFFLSIIYLPLWFLIILIDIIISIN